MLYSTVLFLVLSPCRVPLPQHVPPACWAALKQVASDLEVCGSEGRWLTDFNVEVRWVRTRWLESRHYPPISDAQRLPSNSTCRQNCTFASETACQLEAALRERLHWHQDALESWLTVARRTALFWRIATEATESTTWQYRRRESLETLRVLMGDDSYHAGRWPSPYISWRE